MPTRILILCTGNSCRSQMAEAILRSFDPALEVASAGTHPAAAVHPMAIRVMREAGIDISRHRPKAVEGFLSRPFEHVVTVCDGAREACPIFTGAVAHRHHIGFRDPALATGTDEEVVREFREVRDQIRDAFREFYNQILRKG